MSERVASGFSSNPVEIDAQTQLELEAAAFRQLKEHLMHKRTDVQNIDLMNLAGFCRNCLSKWYQQAANERGIPMTKDEGREAFYGYHCQRFFTLSYINGVLLITCD